MLSLSLRGLTAGMPVYLKVQRRAQWRYCKLMVVMQVSVDHLSLFMAL